MKRNWLHVAASAGFAALLCGVSPASAQTIGDAQSFAIVGGAAVTANGAISSVNGDVGIDPAAAASITGFPGNATITAPFANHGNDASAINAAASVQTLYDSPEMAPGGVITQVGNNLSISGPLGNGHYVPGRYTNVVAGGVAIMPTGITLDTPGIYVFSIFSSLTANGNVTLGPGVDPCTVFWRVPTIADINGIFSGTVVSNAGVHLGPNATVAGRALTTDAGDVTLAGANSIGGCSSAPAGPLPTPPPGPVPTPIPIPPVPVPPVPAPPVPELFIVKRHLGNFIVGTNATYSIALFNSSAIPSSGTITVTDLLPAGLTFVSATGTGWSCSASGQLVTCTTDAVAAAASPFPNNITLTVLPTAAAVPAVTNTAVVFGGGDITPINNTTIDVTIVSPACPPITLSPATLPNGTVGIAYSQTLTGNGGTGPYTFGVAAGALPAGLTLTPAGVLSGTPTGAGTSTFTVLATDANGCFAERTYTMSILPILPCPPITLSPSTLPNGTVGVAISQTITGSGGTGPYIFGVTAGVLPAGVTLTPAGVLSGTPTTVGSSAFTIRGTDANGCFAELPFTVSVITAVPTLPQVFVVLLALGLAAGGYLRLRRRARA